MSLYFVKKNGIDVEVAQNFLELVLKKTGLEPVIAILNQLFEMLFANISSYAVFVEVKKKVDEILSLIIAFSSRF